MASNDPTKTSDTQQRLPSNVPNDYDRLGMPGSLNLPLTQGRRRGAARRRVQARRRRQLPNWLKALLAIGAGTTAFGIVALVIFLIMFPPIFRDWEPRYQQRLIDYFPPATYWMPTRPFEELPTLAGAEDSDAAQQLLLGAGDTATAESDDSGQMVMTPPPTMTPAATATPPADDGGIPVGQVPTLIPSITPDETLATPLPTLLPTYQAPDQAPQPTWTPYLVAVQPTRLPLPAQVRLDPFKYELQGWNNCGPTTMTMALSHFGWPYDQEVAAKWMKPHPEDKNVSPWQMVRFVNDNTTVRALYRVGGNVQLLKSLLAAGFPVVVEESIQPGTEGWMGHYVLLIGYSELDQHFLTYDSYLGYNQGNGRPSPFSTFDERWRHFNRVFMVLYEPARELELRDVLGQYVNPEDAYRVALEEARTEAALDKADKWAWFNMGTNYVALGQYANAAIAYDEALQYGLPFRMLWYQFGPFEAFYRTGRYNDVLAYANSTINTTKYVEETYYWQGMVYAARGETSKAIERFNLALQYNKNFFPAQDAKAQVEAGTFQVANVGF